MAPVPAPGPANGAGTVLFIAMAKREADVFVLNDADWRGEGEVEGGEDWLGIAYAEGAAAGEGFDETGREVGEG